MNQRFQPAWVIAAALRKAVSPGGVYLGVGPEQNFTYIAAVKPRMAFDLDVRRGNLHLHLLYKALFELSANRAEFVSRLFTKPRPSALPTDAAVDKLIATYWNVRSDAAAAYDRNLRDVDDLLVVQHKLPLSQDDLDGIAYVYHAFYWYGPRIRWGSSTSGPNAATQEPTFADLVAQTDGSGSGLSFLASETAFAFVKDLETHNLIVPVVGNFAGPTALRAIGDYVRQHQAVVSVFYLDEVETYLRQDGLWQSFCENAATLPIDDTSVFIRPPIGGAGQGFFSPKSNEQVLFPIRSDVSNCSKR